MKRGQSLMKIYQSVVDDVITGVREAFLDEGVDEHVLNELKQLWLDRLKQSRAMDNSTPAVAAPSVVANQAPQVHKQPITINQPMQQVLVQQGLELTGAASAATMALPSGVYQQQLPPNYTLVPNANGQLVVQHTNVPAAPPPPLANSQPQQTFILQAPGSGGTAALVPATMTVPGQQIQLQAPHIQASQAVTYMAAAPAATVAQNVKQLDGSTDEAILERCVEDVGESAEHLPQVDGSCDETRTSTPSQTPTSSPSQAADDQLSALLLSKASKVVELLLQLDGAHDTSSEDESDEDGPGDDDDDDGSEAREEEPLNTDDDISDEDPETIFDADNVIVCQYDKITRNKGKWKFQLKDGIMNLGGKDFVFQKANGEADW